MFYKFNFIVEKSMPMEFITKQSFRNITKFNVKIGPKKLRETVFKVVELVEKNWK